MKNKKISEENILGVNLQMIMTLVVAVIAILYLLHKCSSFWLELAMGIDLFIMAYNNHTIYHKKNATWYYIGVGVILIVIAILAKLGVI